MKLIQDQGKVKFDSKTTFWMPDPEEGFVWAEMVTDNGATVVMRTHEGNEVCA